MHKEYKRIAQHPETAVLFLHGIVGTPNHFRAFVPLVPEDMSVYNMLLDGHGKGVRDFSHTSMEKWRNQVAGAVGELLKEHIHAGEVFFRLGVVVIGEGLAQDLFDHKPVVVREVFKVEIHAKGLDALDQLGVEHVGITDPFLLLYPFHPTAARGRGLAMVCCVVWVCFALFVPQALK